METLFEPFEIMGGVYICAAHTSVIKSSLFSPFMAISTLGCLLSPHQLNIIEGMLFKLAITKAHNDIITFTMLNDSLMRGIKKPLREKLNYVNHFQLCLLSHLNFVCFVPAFEFKSLH